MLELILYYEVEVRLYGRLFTDANSDAGGKDFMALLNPSSLETIRAYVEPDMRLQFERHGYFVADRVDSVKGVPVFNRLTTLKDSWGKLFINLDQFNRLDPAIF